MKEKLRFIKTCFKYYVIYMVFFFICDELSSYTKWIDAFQGKEAFQWNMANIEGFTIVFFLSLPCSFFLMFTFALFILWISDKRAYFYQIKFICALSLIMALVTLWIDPVFFLAYLFKVAL